MSSLANFYLTQNGALRKNVKLFSLGNEKQPPPYLTYEQLYQLFNLFIELIKGEGRIFEQNLRRNGAAATLEMRGIKMGSRVVQMEYTFRDVAAATEFTNYFNAQRQKVQSHPQSE